MRTFDELQTGDKILVVKKKAGELDKIVITTITKIDYPANSLSCYCFYLSTEESKIYLPIGASYYTFSGIEYWSDVPEEHIPRIVHMLRHED